MELPPTWHVGLMAYTLDNIIIKYARKGSTKSSSATIIHIIDKKFHHKSWTIHFQLTMTQTPIWKIQNLMLLHSKTITMCLND
jgi:hypothetical protein